MIEKEEVKPARKRVNKGEPGDPEALVMTTKLQEEFERSKLGDPEALIYRPGTGESDGPELAGGVG